MILAVDIGGTFVKYGLVDDSHRVVGKGKVPTLPPCPAGELYDYLVASMPFDIKETEAIGISAPGLIDPAGWVRSYAAPNLPGLFGSNLVTEFTDRTGKPSAAINDARAAGLCEFTLGKARGTDSSAFLIIGTGTGGCIFDRNGLVRGADNFAGEFHFMAHWDDSTRQVVKSGRACGMFGLLNQYNEKVPEDQRASLGEEITAKALAGDPLASGVVETWITKISLHCLSIVVAVNPEILCIGGGISKEAWFMDALRKRYRELCLEHFAGIEFLSTRLETCAFGPEANLIGAALNAEASRRQNSPPEPA